MKEIIINLSGALDAVTGSEVYLKIKELTEEPHRILLDLGKMAGIDETGQIYLEKISSRVENTGSVIAVCCRPADIQLDAVFAEFADRQSAITFLQSKSPETAEKPDHDKPVSAPAGGSFDIYCPECGKISRQKKGNGECPHCGVKLYIHSAKRVSAYEKLL